MEKFNLVLTSSGFKNRAKENKEICELFKSIAENKKVLLVINATKKGSNLSAKTEVKDNFEMVGAEVVDLIEIDTLNVSEILNYDVIYGVGGDLETLVEDFIECDFKKYLVEFLKKRSVYWREFWNNDIN